MANYKKQKATVKQTFTYKEKLYKKGSIFEGKKQIIEALTIKNLLE